MTKSHEKTLSHIRMLPIVAMSTSLTLFRYLKVFLTNTGEQNVLLSLGLFLSYTGNQYQNEIHQDLDIIIKYSLFLSVYYWVLQVHHLRRTLPSIFYTYRAWITIDNKLYLWNYLFPQECEIYEGVSEIILSVSLAAPKPGMFVDTIKYVLVIGESASQ